VRRTIRSAPSISSAPVRRTRADTLEILADRFAPARLFFLMGEDSLRDLPTWHDPQRLLRAAELAVAARPGVDSDIEAVARQVPSVEERVHLVPTEEIAISSSEIRRRVADHQSIRGLVPAAVEAYIRDHGLYRRRAS
jgi:nicotinate-nucleotide adenylyltransferase